MKISAILITLFLTLSLVACNGSSKEQNPQFAFLDSLGIAVDDGMLLGDTLSLPDIYCDELGQQDGDFKGLILDHDQYTALVAPAGQNFVDEMGKWLLLGVRGMEGGITLAAYFAGSSVGYCVDLITYDRQGHVLDAINARELHLVWRCDITNPDDDNSFTLDGYFTFDGNDRLTLHRTMGKCLMDFQDDLKGKPQWWQQWEQPYVIDAKGHFVLQGQQVVAEQGNIDHYAVMDFKSWDMLVCSQHDMCIMDTWNDYAARVDTTYAPDYEYNPFPWDVASLYHMNPQRFLRWMGAKREAGNLLLPQFKLPSNDRPPRQWLTSIVNSWDDKPLTKHL